MLKNSFSEFEETLQNQGLNSSLKYLNQRVKHRFTAISRFDNDLLKISHLIDKLNDASTFPFWSVPFKNSFCELVMTDGALMTANSVVDKRFEGKSAQGVVIAYVGLPLVQQGKLFGTFCHMDYSENRIDEDEFAFLQKVMGVLPRYL